MKVSRRRVSSILASLPFATAPLFHAARLTAQACCGGSPQGALPVVLRIRGAAGTLTASLDWQLRQLDTPERTPGPALAPLLNQRVTMQLYTAAVEASAPSFLTVAVVAPFVVNQESIPVPDGTTLSGTAAGIGDVALVGKLDVLVSDNSVLM